MEEVEQQELKRMEDTVDEAAPIRSLLNIIITIIIIRITILIMPFHRLVFHNNNSNHLSNFIIHTRNSVHLLLEHGETIIIILLHRWVQQVDINNI